MPIASGATRARPLRVAVLYSGRFFGDLVNTQSWYSDHLQHLIRPYNASVIVVVTPLNWCNAPKEAADLLKAHNGTINSDNRHAITSLLRSDISRAFGGWNDLHVSLASDEWTENWSAPDASRSVEQCFRVQEWARLAPAKFSFESRVGYRRYFGTYSIKNWALQFAHFAEAEALRKRRGREHDIVIRARIDVLFDAPLMLRDLSLTHDRIFAIAVGSNERARGHLWRDWLYVGTSTAMASLASMLSLPVVFAVEADPSQRGWVCIGAGGEEQVELQLAARNIAMQPLAGAARLVRLQDSSKYHPVVQPYPGHGPCSSSRVAKGFGTRFPKERQMTHLKPDPAGVEVLPVLGTNWTEYWLTHRRQLPLPPFPLNLTVSAPIK